MARALVILAFVLAGCSQPGAYNPWASIGNGLLGAASVAQPRPTTDAQQIVCTTHGIWTNCGPIGGAPVLKCYTVGNQMVCQ